MVQSQNFVVQHESSDLTINGGALHYDLDLDTGKFDYKASVSVTWMHISHEFTGSTKIALDQLLSAHYQKIGSKLTIGNFTLTVTGVSGGKTATCQLTDSDLAAQGTGLIDISGKYVKILALDAVGQYGGQHVHLVINQA